MGFGIKELVIVLVIVLLVFGTKRLKSTGSDLGSAIRGFRKSVSEEEEETEQKEKPSDKKTMFDIGFVELLIVAILSLIILGPERMPIAIRQIALWLGRLKRYFRRFKKELEDEIGADEIKRQLYNEELLEQINPQNTNTFLEDTDKEKAISASHAEK